jgi:hypothetical protein
LLQEHAAQTAVMVSDQVRFTDCATLFKSASTTDRMSLTNLAVGVANK